MKILILGYLVRGPLGGLAWHHLQYVVGLHRMGHDVTFIEVGDGLCYDPSRHVTDGNAAYGLDFIQQCFDRFGLAGRWAFHDPTSGSWLGDPRHPIPAIEGDVLINVSGVNDLVEPLDRVDTRVFVDTDPGFTQVRLLEDVSLASAICHESGARVREIAADHFGHEIVLGELLSRL